MRKTYETKLKRLRGVVFWVALFSLTGNVQALPKNTNHRNTEYVSMIEKCDVITTLKCSPVRIFAEEKSRSRKPLFIKLQTSDDMEVRAKMAEALGQIGGEGVREALIKAAETNLSSKVKFSAIEALGKLQDRETLPFLESKLKEDGVAMRIAAANALSSAGFPDAIPALIEASGHYHPKSKASVLDALGTLGKGTPGVAEIVLNMLGNMTLPWSVHNRAMVAVESLGLKEAGPLVIGFLNHKQTELVGRACRTLGALKLDYATPSLLHVMKNSSINGGIAAIALIHTKDDEVTNTVNWAGMNPDLTFRVRRQFFRSMALRKSSKSVRPLSTLLGSSEDQLVILTLETLGQLGHPSAGPGIRPLLEHSSDEIRSHAEWAMEQISGLKHGGNLEAWDTWLKSL